MNRAEIIANADCFRVNASRFMENASQFMENVGQFMKNVGQFMENIGEFMENGGRFMENQRRFMKNRSQFVENRGRLMASAGRREIRPEFHPLVTPMIPLVTRSSSDPDAAGHDTRRKETTMKLFTTTLLVLKMVLVLTALPCSADETAINKAVARRVYEDGLSRGIFTVPYTDDFVGHGGSRTFTHEDGMNEAKGWRSAFPDLTVNVDLMVAEGDLVAVRWTARGTNTGTGNGIPATGRKVQVSGTAIFRFVDGKIAEEWTSANTLGLLQQLGLR